MFSLFSNGAWGLSAIFDDLWVFWPRFQPDRLMIGHDRDLRWPDTTYVTLPWSDVSVCVCACVCVSSCLNSLCDGARVFFNVLSQACMIALWEGPCVCVCALISVCPCHQAIQCHMTTLHTSICVCVCVCLCVCVCVRRLLTHFSRSGKSNSCWPSHLFHPSQTLSVSQRSSIN